MKAPSPESPCLVDQAAGEAAWAQIAEAGVPDDLVRLLQEQFTEAAPRLADADMALRNLSRFLTTARNPLSTSALFERDLAALPNLLQILSTSQYLADLLVRDQECFDLLRMSEGQPVARETLVLELVQEVSALGSFGAVATMLRRTKQRETLRIAYGDIVRGQPVSVVARQISLLADAILESAVAYLQQELDKKLGVPRCRNGSRARFCVLALGKLGGIELNYSSDIDLILLYEEEGQTDHQRTITNREYFERLSRELVKLVGEITEQGAAYRVDLRLRPEGSRGPICMAIDPMLAYYDTQGRTWERQAMIKARPVAGDRDLGQQLLDHLQPWVYRRYLTVADIAGIKSLKRRIERRTHTQGESESNVKTGHGGIRDIEFVLQFLQLLNGGALAEVRGGNTREAIERLEHAGCLTPQERSLLEENYDFLRKLEHRLQIMFDLQTHTLPEEEEELRKVAVRMGFVGIPHKSALDAFRADYAQRTDVNRKILDHLLHDAFGETGTDEPEVDLVNDPDPSQKLIHEVLGRYPFKNVPAAYTNLMALATEKIRFLSTRRCRHFLASISPRLLATIANTPDPDGTLINLSRVSDSIGGKAALWELFSHSQPSLDLYVRLCAACPYLADLLTSNPGMVDELMDSLLVDRLPTLEVLEQSLTELAYGAEDLDPILHSFKHAQHLRVGVRDILGKDDIRDTHAALSDTAESCLKVIAAHAQVDLVAKYGVPTIAPPTEQTPEKEAAWLTKHAGQPSEVVLLALGKLGGREPNYHSDLDLVFLYEADGMTRPTGRHGKGHATTNGHFFGELGQRIMKVTNHMSSQGRLYEIDPRLRPTGRSGTLAVPLAKFREYYDSGAGQLWERQALCKARVIYGSPEAAQRAMDVVAHVAYGPAWDPQHAEAIEAMRYRLEETASPRNLKRGRGGTVDTEFLVQMLQLQHGAADPTVRVPGTLDALTALAAGGYLSFKDAERLSASYRLQRNVEARIRLMNSTGRHEFPTDRVEQQKLAYLMGYVSPEQLEQEVQSAACDTRSLFERLFSEAKLA